MIELNTILDLQNETGMSSGDLRYVKGYYNTGDGGEGVFKFDPLFPSLLLNEGIAIKTSTTGAWLREYSGYINILYFGVKRGYGLTGNSILIQDAIDCANKFGIRGNSEWPGDLTLYFPDGMYSIDKPIKIISGTHIKGDTGTTLNAWHEKLSDVYDYMFEIDNGPVENVIIENLTIDCQGLAPIQRNTGAFHIKAKPDRDRVGGLWNSTFRKIKILAALKHGIWLEGGNDECADGRLGNQYLLFEHVWVERLKNSKQDVCDGKLRNCLRMEGQSNVNVFINCQFQIPYVTSDIDTGMDYGTNICITATSNTPLNNNLGTLFLNCATGGAGSTGTQYGFEIINAQNITIQDGWIEDVDFGISIKGSTGINILNNRFANAAGCGGRPYSAVCHLGACIAAEESLVNIERNYVTVSSDIESNPYEGDTLLILKKERFIIGIGKNNTLNVRNNSFDNIILSETQGVIQYTNIEGVQAINYYPSAVWVEGISTGSKKLVLVESGVDSYNRIERINSTINCGEMLVIRAEKNDITLYQWDPEDETRGWNLWLSGNSTVLIPQGCAATFIKTDGKNNKELCSYQLISVY